MSEHTKEPWALDDTDDGLVLEGHERWPMDEEYICLLIDISKSDARRIVACVNACAGWTTEDLEAGAISASVDTEMQWERAMMAAIGEDGVKSVSDAIATLKAQRDGMLAALQMALADHMTEAYLHPLRDGTVEAIRCAIANAENPPCA